MLPSNSVSLGKNMVYILTEPVFLSPFKQYGFFQITNENCSCALVSSDYLEAVYTSQHSEGSPFLKSVSVSRAIIQIKWRDLAFER